MHAASDLINKGTAKYECSVKVKPLKQLDSGLVFIYFIINKEFYNEKKRILGFVIAFIQFGPGICSLMW